MQAICEIRIICDKVRIACVSGWYELNRKVEVDPSAQQLPKSLPPADAGGSDMLLQFKPERT